MLSETCFEIDFNFSDVLSSIDDNGSVTSGKKTDSNGNLNSFNLSFSVDSVLNYKSTTGIEKDDLDDDLSSLLDSCHVHKDQSSDLISLAALADNHLSNNLLTSVRKPENSLSSPFVSSLKNEVSDGIQLLDCLEDIMFEGKSEEDNQISCPENFLNNLQWEHSSISDCEKSERNHPFDPRKETVDDELIPDINLSFCIKKNNKDKFSPMSISPESSDSGFDEIDFSSDKCDSGSSDETSSLECTFGNTNLVKPSLISSKQSLLSRAVSARPKTDKSRREKLQNIRSGLLGKYIPKPFFEYKQKQNLKKFEKITDQSDECIITSGFLTISGQ